MKNVNGLGYLEFLVKKDRVYNQLKNKKHSWNIIKTIRLLLALTTLNGLNIK